MGLDGPDAVVAAAQSPAWDPECLPLSLQADMKILPSFKQVNPVWEKSDLSLVQQALSCLVWASSVLGILECLFVSSQMENSSQN